MFIVFSFTVLDQGGFGHLLKPFLSLAGCQGILSGLPGGASGKEPICQCRRHVRDSGLISGLVRFPGGGHSNPLQYSCLENPMDRGASWVMVHNVVNSWIPLKCLSTHACVAFFRQADTLFLRYLQTRYGLVCCCAWLVFFICFTPFLILQLFKRTLSL